MIDYISATHITFLLFVNRSNIVGITKYEGVGFELSSDNLLYSTFHDTEEKYRQKDNHDYLGMTATYDSIQNSRIH